MKKGHKVSLNLYYRDIAFDNSKEALIFYDLLNKGIIIDSEYIDGTNYIYEDSVMAPTISPCEILSKEEIETIRKAEEEKKASESNEEAA